MAKKNTERRNFSMGTLSYTVRADQFDALKNGRWRPIRHRFGGITSHIVQDRDNDLFTVCGHGFGKDQVTQRQAAKTCSTCQMVEEQGEKKEW